MILQALADFSRREGLVQDSSFEYAGVAWAIEIGLDGTFYDLRDLRTDSSGKKKKLLPRQMLVPKRSKRTVQDQEEFLVDKAEYVLGVGDADVERRDRRRLLFAGAIERAAEALKMPDLLAVVHFLGDEAARTKCAEQLAAMNPVGHELFCFLVEDEFLHDNAKLKTYWQQMRTDTGAARTDDQCLLCGKMAQAARLHPNIKGLAGASTSGVPMVSFNKPAYWSYGWENNRNADVCDECAAAYATALNRCLSSEFPDPRDPEAKLTRQAYLLSGNLTAVYWSDDSSTGVERLVNSAVSDPDQAQAVLKAPWQGGVTLQALRFHCLLLQGAQGRATVRSYHSELISRIHQNVRDWFTQIAVGTDRTLTLPGMLSSLAVQRKFMKLPPNLSGEIYLAILFGFQIPLNAVHLALSRNRAEAGPSPARVALIQAWLARRPQPNERKLLVKLEPDYPSTGYQLGRLLAVCEHIQDKASGGKLNKSLTDRYFSALSTRPVFVLGALMRLTKLRLSQIRRRNESTYLERTLGDVFVRIAPDALPANLTLEEQAKFTLGYYHQRQARFAGAPESLVSGDDIETDSNNQEELLHA